MSMLQDYFPVTGCGTVQKIFDRLPLQELAVDHPYQWSLFVLGWAYIKGTPISFPGVVQPPLCSITSFMEIASIHGKPYRDWAGDRLEEPQANLNHLDRKDVNPRAGGYCHHATVTFPSWHRLYVMLIEQVIGKYAENIAEQIENSYSGEEGRWLDAAAQLRFPYWDWADPKVDIEGFLSLFYTEELSIMGTAGKSLTVLNPLVSFEFPYIPDDFMMAQSVVMLPTSPNGRKPTDTLSPPQTQLEATLKHYNRQALKQRADNIRTSVGMLFSFPYGGNPGMIYDEFSNRRNKSRQEDDHNNIGSLEAVHDTIHVIVGSGGHMAWPDYAAFDPFFFFHHSNVDRILALWEWCYPEYWMAENYTIGEIEQKRTTAQGTYSVANSDGIEEDLKCGPPLLHSGIQAELTGQAMKLAFLLEIRTLNVLSSSYLGLTADIPLSDYSYKEFVGVKVDRVPFSFNERQEARARIAKYYNVDLQKAASTIHVSSWAHISVPDVGIPPNFRPIKNFRIFKVMIRLSEHAMGASYLFNLYYKDELVGSIAVFAREDSSPCKACSVRRMEDSVVYGVITIPSRIINEIIVCSSVSKSQITMDATVGLIVQALSGTLEDVNGTVLASAQGGTVAPCVPAARAAPATIHPVEVVLMSSAVAEDIKDEKHPVHFFDWKRHMDIFPNGWKDEMRAPATRCVVV